MYLQTSNDWEKWFTRLRELAKRKDVWEYFDPDSPDSPTLKRPTPLTVDSTFAAINEARHAEYQNLYTVWED